MRIISGKSKGKKLYTAAGPEIRPSPEKLREAVFSICSSRIPHARILDLFAGSGAFGLEALSRGASKAVFVDSDRRAVTAIKKNIQLCGEHKRAQCIKWDISMNLDCLNSIRPGFDMVFIDPPYQSSLVSLSLENLEKSGCLENNALVVVEHSARAPFPELKPPFSLTDRRKYGKSLVSFLSFML